METGPLSRHIADAARELQDETDAQATLDKAVGLAVRLVGAAEDAAISLVHRGGRIDTPAATSDVARRVDKLQYELDQGPCLDAIRKEELVLAPDLATDTRWSQWGSRVASETGIRSMMCLRLFTYAHTVGALNLYARSRNAFGRDDIEQGQALAAHAAVAVVGAQRIDQLSVALDTRTVIAQAQGILMERYRFTADQAFNVLVRVSSQANAKLRDVAIELVETRRTPGHKPPEPP
ncbi:GAF and ANTAR domain-containing protein [Actinopolymorpha singaporensis]|uniref:GAF domain-containing protein n=1 Tax=Actinopolymorpha singaporensis TaxID=117157 RepID=A0A1H1U1R1_9ACTN|nr:GAF and ANTAR domain-containing protein [Actinopolymorpha singaporensis]SDS66417.1 GAF domain-containing protein [Actinopolymorpha singaporensis]